MVLVDRRRSKAKLQVLSDPAVGQREYYSLRTLPSFFCLSYLARLHIHVIFYTFRRREGETRGMLTGETTLGTMGPRTSRTARGLITNQR